MEIPRAWEVESILQEVRLSHDAGSLNGFEGDSKFDSRELVLAIWEFALGIVPTWLIQVDFLRIIFITVYFLIISYFTSNRRY